MKEVCKVFFQIEGVVFNKKGKRLYSFAGTAREHWRYVESFTKEALEDPEYVEFLEAYVRKGFSYNTDCIQLTTWDDFRNVKPDQTIRFTKIVQVAEGWTCTMQRLIEVLPYEDFMEFIKDHGVSINLS